MNRVENAGELQDDDRCEWPNCDEFADCVLIDEATSEASVYCAVHGGEKMFGRGNS